MKLLEHPIVLHNCLWFFNMPVLAPTWDYYTVPLTDRAPSTTQRNSNLQPEKDPWAESLDQAGLIHYMRVILQGGGNPHCRHAYW